MIGIPLIITSLLIFPFNRRRAAMLFTVGWLFQLTGHFLFEHNRPELTRNPRDPLIYISALIFVVQEWLSVLTGRGIRPDSDGRSK